MWCTNLTEHSLQGRNVNWGHLRTKYITWRLLGPLQEEESVIGGWRRLLMKRFIICALRMFVMSLLRRTRYLWQVEGGGTGGARNVYTVVICELRKMRLYWRTRYKWWDNINIILRKFVEELKLHNIGLKSRTLFYSEVVSKILSRDRVTINGVSIGN
jgi:hypothetical protein